MASGRGWDLVNGWGVDAYAAVRQLALLWILGLLPGFAAGGSLQERFGLALASAALVHLLCWLGSYVIVHRGLFDRVLSPASRDEVRALAALAEAFGDPLGITGWSYSRAGRFERALAMMNDPEVDALVAISRVAPLSDAEAHLSIGFSGQLRRGHQLSALARFRPLIRRDGVVVLYDLEASPERLWAEFRERLLTEGRPASLQQLSEPLEASGPTLVQAVRFLADWSVSPWRRSGDLGG